MPRVVILVENLSVPFDRRVWQESKALVEAGYEVDVVCPRGARYDTEYFVEIDGVSIHRYDIWLATGGPAGYFREYAGALWRTLRLVRACSRTGPVDVIHACNPPDLLFLIALAVRHTGARFLFDHHDLVPELFESRFEGGSRVLLAAAKVLEKATFRCADAVISTNESYRRVAIERGGVPADHVTVVRSAPDLFRFTPVPPDPVLRRGKPYLACYLGVMGPQDGVDLALNSIAHLRQQRGRDDLYTTFIGSGDALDECRLLASKLGLDDVVEFTGRISDDEVRAWLSTADVCLSPDPKNPLNNISSMNKLVEYMSMGKPVVSFDLLEARVTADDAAVYARDNNVQEFGRLLGELLDDPERRAVMGKLGRRRVEESLSWETSRVNLLRAYEEMMARPRRTLLRRRDR